MIILIDNTELLGNESLFRGLKSLAWSCLELSLVPAIASVDVLPKYLF